MLLLLLLLLFSFGLSFRKWLSPPWHRKICGQKSGTQKYFDHLHNAYIILELVLITSSESHILNCLRIAFISTFEFRWAMFYWWTHLIAWHQLTMPKQIPYTYILVSDIKYLMMKFIYMYVCITLDNVNQTIRVYRSLFS